MFIAAGTTSKGTWGSRVVKVRKRWQTSSYASHGKEMQKTGVTKRIANCALQMFVV